MSLCCFAQYPCKDLVYCFLCKAMPEVIAYRGKMRRFLLQGITEKPAIAIVCADFFRCPPQRGKAVQMLDQHHLEQHHRIDAGAPIILAIERLHHFIQLCEVHRCIYLSQQMLLRHQLVYDYELYQISIHFPAFQHLFITRLYCTIYMRKSTAFAGLFRQTEAGDCMPVSRYILMHFLRPCGRTHLATES